MKSVSDSRNSNPSFEFPKLRKVSYRRVDPAEVALLYDHFVAAEEVEQVLSTFQRLCHVLDVKDSSFQGFFEQLRQKLAIYPKAKRMIDDLYSMAVDKGCIESQNKSENATVDEGGYLTSDTPNCCINRNVLIVGGGPCGLRMAIEARLLGARVMVLEKRKDFLRYNIAHLWQQAVVDLQTLKPRAFCQDLCCGSHNTISIRQLQFFLLKTALCFGVEFHPGICYENLIEPTSNIGWQVETSPNIPQLEDFKFDVLVDASGKRNLVYEIDTPNQAQSIENKRAVRTMIAIAANFVNSGRMSERFPEVNGVSGHLTGSDSAHHNYATRLQQKGYGVEAIAYFRRETHYVIFTTKKNVIKQKNLIKEDSDSLKPNLSKNNINRVNLEKYVLDVVNELIHMTSSDDDVESPPRRINQFHVNERGENDVNIFGFEALACASNSSKILERKGKTLLLASVGDSLTSPFWPEGTGIIKGFMSAFDTCWVLKLWSQNEKKITPLQLLGTKEYLYSHLRYIDKQSVFGGIIKTCDGKQKIINDRKIFAISDQKKKDPTAFRAKLDPWCRYNRSSMIKKNYAQMINLYDTDLDVRSKILEDVALFEPATNLFRRTKNYGAGVILDWYNELLAMFDLPPVVDFSSSWTNGIALLATISLWSHELVDWLNISGDDEKNVQRAINIVALRCGIPPPLTSHQIVHLTQNDEGVMANYLEKLMQFITTNYEYLIVESGGKYGGLSNNLKRPGQCLPGVENIKYKLGDLTVENIKFLMSGKGTVGEIYKDENENEMKIKKKVERKCVMNNKETEETRSFDEREACKEGIKYPKNAPLSKQPTMIKEKSLVEGHSPKPNHAKSKSFKAIQGDLIEELKIRLNRSGSFPNIHVGGTTGETCVVCNKLVYAASKILVQPNNNAVHELCLRCDECDRSLIGETHTFDSNIKCFYCEDHQPTNEIKEEDSDDDHDLTMEDLSTAEKIKDNDLKPEKSKNCTQLYSGRTLTFEQVKDPKVLRMLVDNDEVYKAILEAVNKQPKLKLAVYNEARSFPSVPKIRIQPPTEVEIKNDVSVVGHLSNVELDMEIEKSKIEDKNSTENERISSSKLTRVSSCPQLDKKKLYKCGFCWKKILQTNNIVYVYDHVFHNYCFKCAYCQIKLTLKTFCYDYKSRKFFCTAHKGELGEIDEVVYETPMKSKKVKKQPDLNKLAQSAKKLACLFRIKN